MKARSECQRGTDGQTRKHHPIPVYALLLLIAIAGQPSARAAETNALTPATPVSLADGAIRHRFVCTDYTQGKVFIISAEGNIEWEYPAEHCNDISILPNGNFLFNTGHGVKEVTQDKKVVFDYESSSAIYACQRLSNGNTFVGECNAARLLEVSPAGAIVKEIHLLPIGQDGGAAYMRNARRLENGHYLVAHYGADVVREYDADGKIVLEIAAPGGPHSAERLPNGHTLISTADHKGGPRFFEADATGKTVWELRQNDVPAVNLKFLAGFERLSNGNTVLANWLGHGQMGKAPDLVEITSDKRVVWTFTGYPALKTVSNFRMLEERPVAGKLTH